MKKKLNWNKIATVLAVLLVVLTVVGVAIAPSHYKREWNYRIGCDVVIDFETNTTIDTVIIKGQYMDIYFSNDEYITLLTEPITVKHYSQPDSKTVYYYYGYRVQAEYENINGDQYLIVTHLK